MTNQSVPQTSKSVQTEFNFNAVKLEPELQLKAATLNPDDRRALARIYFRWARQLWVSARVLELHAVPWKRRRLPHVSEQILRSN